MHGRTFAAMIVAAWGLGSAGCAQPTAARYVYQDGEFGVVGIPQNSSRWPTFYREQAETLMARHFPEGYEIVRAEEVVQGKRDLSIGRTTETDLEPGLLIPATNNFVKLGKIDRTATRKREDMLQITEARILYKRKDGRLPSGAYARLANLSPPLYLDPNLTARLDESHARADAARVASGKADHEAGHPDVIQASAKSAPTPGTTAVTPSGQVESKGTTSIVIP